MSISSALKSALTGLQAVEKQISVASGNISNAATPGYAKQRAELATQVVAGDVAGVSVVGITSEINENVIGEIRNQSGDLAEKNTLSEFYQRIELLYGSPGTAPSLSDRVTDFFSGLQSLSDNPETLSLRQNAVSGAEDLTRFVGSAATQLHSLRFEADQGLKASFDNVNAIVEKLYGLNQKISGFEPSTGGYQNLVLAQNDALRELSEYLPISVTRGSGGAVSVTGPDGISLLDNRRYKIEYTASTSADSLIEGLPFSAATVVALDANGNPDGTAKPILVSGGTSDQVTTGVEKGKIKALLEMRDQVLPELILQLDGLASTVKNEINAVHNDGAAFPPPSELNGTRTVADDTLLGFTGSVRIAVLQEDGSPALSPYSDEIYYTPLTIDLASLNDGSGAGKFDVETLMNEINSYYGAPQAKASVGNLRNVSLVLRDDALADGGSASFALEYDNVSTLDSTVEILDVQIVDPTDSSSTYPAVTVPGAGTSVKGTRAIGDDFTLDFSGDDNRSQYDVNVTLRVTDADGNVSESVVSYSVADNIASGGYNKRHAATGSTVTSGDGSYLSSPSGKTFIKASLKDEDGNTAASGEPGFLTLTAGSGFRIAISELNGKHTSTDGLTSAATGKGISSFFGLNDFFVTDDPDTIAGSAVSLAVRSDIAANPNKIAVGRLALSTQPLDPTQALYTYELGSGNGAAARAMAAVSSEAFSFAATGAFPQASMTISGYSANVITYMATQSDRVASEQSVEQAAFDGLMELNQEFSGVDVDEELAKIVELENQYVASATLIGTLRSMMDALRGVFG
jgi:flagellar hook-associated protein 1 FlgK